MSMPFYVSPEQSMRDKADYARKGIARGRSCVALQYAGGILLVAPNPSSALHKISEIYDRIGFAAVGRYNEYENLRKAGVTYADITGYQFDRHDVTARGIANWYAQTLGTIFTESPKPFEVEIVVAEVGARPADDQIYRITFDGSVTDEPGFVAFGGQADQVSAALKEHYSDDMSLSEAFAAALAALSAQSNGERPEFAAAQLEVAILDRARDHRTFRRIRAARLEELLAEARPAAEPPADSSEPPSARRPRPPGSSGLGLLRLLHPRHLRPQARPAPAGPLQPQLSHRLRASHRSRAGRLRPRHRPGRRLPVSPSSPPAPPAEALLPSGGRASPPEVAPALRPHPSLPRAPSCAPSRPRSRGQQYAGARANFRHSDTIRTKTKWPGRGGGRGSPVTGAFRKPRSTREAGR